MILEERTYHFLPGAVPLFWQLYSSTSESVERPMVGNLLGYFQNDPDRCDRVTLLLKYTDFEHRSAQYAKLENIAAAVSQYTSRLHPLLTKEQNRILSPISPMLSPLAKLSEEFGWLHDPRPLTFLLFEREILTVAMRHLAEVHNWFRDHAASIVEALGDSLLGVFTCEIGAGNEVTIYRRFRNWSHRDSLRGGAEWAQTAQGFDRSVMPLLCNRVSEFLVPSPVPKLTPLAHV